MGQCYLKLYDHFDYRGHLKTFTKSAYNGHPNSNDRDASGTVTGDCKNTTWLGFEHPAQGGYAWIMGEGGSLSNFQDAHDKCNVKDRKIWNFQDQNNSIKRIEIPTQNINEGRMRQDITIYANRRDTRNCQYATYPKITNTSDGKFNAADKDQWLVGHNDKKGEACPGGEAYWKGYRKISCIYDVKTGSGLGRIRELHGEIKNTFAGDPRKAMFDNIVSDYCDRADRLNDKVTSDGGDDSTCRAFSNAKAMAKDFCEIGDNIAKETSYCTKESDSLGPTLYNELAENYCKNNPDKEFCACYNVTQPGLCEQAPNLPGCKTVQPIWDKITESLDEGDIAQFEGMQPCYGSVCAGNVYQPTSWDTNCNKDISICKADFDIGGDLVGSNINLKQDCGNTNEGGDGGGTTTTNTTTEEEKSLIEKVFKLEEDKDKKVTEKRTTKIGGTVSSISSCFMCMIAIVLFT